MTNTRSQGQRVLGDGSLASTVRQTIVETIEAPRLLGLSTGDFVKFKNDRELYERRIAEELRTGALRYG